MRGANKEQESTTSRMLGLQPREPSVVEHTATPVRSNGVDVHTQLRANAAFKARMLQLRAAGVGGVEATHQAAADGVRRARASLPYLDVIQRSFGRHDVTGVRAAVGGEAKAASEAIGAEAYATGDRVAFREAPTLHTAAHEAAHVVQQRAGVSLPGGVGAAGDRYEQHADAVADAVVTGKSAEALLDQMTDGTRAGPSVQRKQSTFEITPKDPQAQLKAGKQALADALAIQLAADREVTQRILANTQAPALPPPGLEAVFQPLLDAAHTATRQAEAMEVLSRVSLRLKRVKSKRMFRGDFKRKQATLSALPRYLDGVADQAAVDTLERLFELGGGNYSTAIKARYAALRALWAAYDAHAVDRSAMKLYMLHGPGTPEERTAKAGQLAAALMRGHFLLGRLNEGGGEKPIGPALGTHPFGWEHDDDGRRTQNTGPSIEPIAGPMGGGTGYWCTKTAGQPWGQLGLLQPDGSQLRGKLRTTVMSNSKLTAYASQGKTVDGRQLVDADKAPGQSGGGAVFEGQLRQADRPSWFKLKKHAEQFANDARLLQESGKFPKQISTGLLHPLTDPTAFARLFGKLSAPQVQELYLSGQPDDGDIPLIAALYRYFETIPKLPPSRLPPQAGDLLSVGAERHQNRKGESVGGKGGHTVMVERFDKTHQVIYTIEGNQADRMSGRAIDLTKPSEYASGKQGLNVYALTRFGVPQFADEHPEVTQSPAPTPPPPIEPIEARLTQLNEMVETLAKHWGAVHQVVNPKGEALTLVYHFDSGEAEPRYLDGSVR